MLPAWGCWRRQMATAPAPHSRPPSVGGQGNGQFRVARSVVIAPTVAVMVPIPVMIPVVVPVVIGLLHAFAVATALMSLGRHDGAGNEFAEMPSPISAAAIEPNIIRRIFYSLHISTNRFRAERLRTWVARRRQPDLLVKI